MQLSKPTANDIGVLVIFARKGRSNLTDGILARLLAAKLVEYKPRKPKEDPSITISRNRAILLDARNALKGICPKNPERGVNKLRDYLYKLKSVESGTCTELVVSATGWIELKSLGVIKEESKLC